MKKHFFWILVLALLFSCDKFDELLHRTTNSKAASALNFDGQDDEVNLGDWFRYKVFTIQFWAKPGVTQNDYANIIDNEHASYISWTIQQLGNNINHYEFGGGAYIHFDLQSKVWQHVSVV